MRIAVNTRMLLKGRMEGIGNFTNETMHIITKNHPEHEFIFIFDREFDPSFVYSKNIIPVTAFPPARHPFLWYLWYEISLPLIYKKYKADIFIGTDGYVSLSSKIRSVAVFHDLNFEHYPKDIPRMSRFYYRHFFPKYARHATRLAAVSQFTKSDIVNTYKTDTEKIDIVYNGVSEKFKPVNDDVKAATMKKFSNGKPYFLFVGALHQRKNIANLLLAFDDYKKNNPSPVQLLLAGQKRWWTQDMEDALTSMTHKSEVIFTGRVSDQDLFDITASAFAMTYVSIFEGFGIPILESMKCNVPVITSNITSMPEISGDAALLCDPFNVESISGAMTKIFQDENLRMQLIEKGKKRSDFFSWEKTAGQLWKSIEKCF
jgi:glycosyltransferase involved in cell wall biosynthesis